ncbi:MAG: hypothetical protein J0I14_08495 [Propionibacteriaceae bacterium]|nr:hypothetical protein [Propionibacteriaceae bacterium]
MDQFTLADDLAGLLRTIHSLPTDRHDGNGLGRRGRPLADTDWVRSSITRSAHLIDADAATAVWERALSAPAHRGRASYIHGDPVPGTSAVASGVGAGLMAGSIDIALQNANSGSSSGGSDCDDTDSDMLGAKGTQTKSSTMTGPRSPYRIDVEKPAPGQRPGQMHLHTPDGVKYQYDFTTGEWKGLPASIAKKIANNPEIIGAIAKGARFLGVK